MADAAEWRLPDLSGWFEVPDWATIPADEPRGWWDPQSDVVHLELSGGSEDTEPDDRNDMYVYFSRSDLSRMPDDEDDKSSRVVIYAHDFGRFGVAGERSPKWAWNPEKLRPVITEFADFSDMWMRACSTDPDRVYAFFEGSKVVEDDHWDVDDKRDIARLKIKSSGETVAEINLLQLLTWAAGYLEES